VFDERTTSTYEIITSLPKPKHTHEQNSGYAEINTEIFKEFLENFNVSSFFRHTLNLEEEEDPEKFEMNKEVSYTLYFAESKRHECLKLKIMIGVKDTWAMLDTGCEMSIRNEQLFNKLRLFGLSCLEFPTQHLNLVSVVNDRIKSIRKQALLEIQVGDSKVDQVVLLSPQLLTDAMLGLDFLIDHAAELRFPDKKISPKINEIFCNFELYYIILSF